MSWHYVGAVEANAPLPVRLASIWKHRRLLRRMAERDLRQRYVGSTLGFAWAAIHPLLFVSIYTFIFTFVFGPRLTQGGPVGAYALYVVTGLLPWVSFSEVASKATQTMAEHRNLVKFVVFPVQILPLTSLYATALSQGVGLAAVLALAVAMRGGLDAALLLLIPTIVCQIIFLTGVAWLLGAVGAVFRDIKELVQVVLMVGMFLTPIFYQERDVPSRLRIVLLFNPMTHLVRLYRDALLGQGVQHPASLAVFAVCAVATMALGFVAFERVRVFLSDIL